MQALQRVAPQIKELQEKYKDDKQRLKQETMKFYQENKVNPFGSCLPLVLQMPVFISLFYMLRKDLRHDICPDINPPTVANPKPCGSTEASQFFFIPDITDKATGAVLVTLLVLYIGSQLLSSVLMSATADRNQRLLIIALPFVFVAFIISFPAGLLLYWITTNLWTVGQGIVIRKRAGRRSVRSQPARPRAPRCPRGASGRGTARRATTTGPRRERRGRAARTPRREGRRREPRRARPRRRPRRGKKKKRSGRRR